MVQEPRQLSRFELPSLHLPGATWLVSTWSSAWSGRERRFTELGWAMDGREAWDVGSFEDEALARAAVAGLESAAVPAKEALAAAGFGLHDPGSGFSTGDKAWLRREGWGVTSIVVMGFDETRLESVQDHAGRARQESDTRRLGSVSAFASMPPAMLGSRLPGASKVAALLAVLGNARG